MPRKHRNPFIPFERARDMEDAANIAEKKAKQLYTRQQAELRAQGAPLKQRIHEKERQKEIQAPKTTTPPHEK